MNNVRYFIASGRPGVQSSVHHWRWKRRLGLQVWMKNASQYVKSEYTLRELLSSSRPEGSVVECGSLAEVTLLKGM